MHKCACFSHIEGFRNYMKCFFVVLFVFVLFLFLFCFCFNSIVFLLTSRTKEIAVVGHSSFLERLFNSTLHCNDDKDLVRYFDNCELRSVSISFPHPST